jgi:DNA gyrase subunit B
MRKFVCTDSRGLHYLIGRVVDNAADEAANRHACTIEVTLLHDGGVQISDDGRGIAFAVHASGVPTVGAIFAPLPDTRSVQISTST